jgi:hypothetical protein
MATLTKNVIDNREAGYIDKLPLQQLLEQIFGPHDFRIKVSTRFLISLLTLTSLVSTNKTCGCSSHPAGQLPRSVSTSKHTYRRTRADSLQDELK